MIIYEVANLKLGTHHYVAELISQAEIDTFNKNGLEPLWVGTSIPMNMVKTVLVDKFEGLELMKIYERAKPYVIETPDEVIAHVIFPKVKKIAAPSVDTRTTEDIKDDLEKQYREFILLLHKSEMELSSIRRTMEDALHKIQDQKILEKFHK